MFSCVSHSITNHLKTNISSVSHFTSTMFQKFQSSTQTTLKHQELVKFEPLHNPTSKDMFNRNWLDPNPNIFKNSCKFIQEHNQQGGSLLLFPTLRAPVYPGGTIYKNSEYLEMVLPPVKETLHRTGISELFNCTEIMNDTELRPKTILLLADGLPAYGTKQFTADQIRFFGGLPEDTVCIQLSTLCASGAYTTAIADTFLTSGTNRFDIAILPASNFASAAPHYIDKSKTIYPEGNFSYEIKKFKDNFEVIVKNELPTGKVLTYQGEMIEDLEGNLVIQFQSKKQQYTLPLSLSLKDPHDEDGYKDYREGKMPFVEGDKEVRKHIQEGHYTSEELLEHCKKKVIETKRAEDIHSSQIVPVVLSDGSGGQIRVDKDFRLSNCPNTEEGIREMFDKQKPILPGSPYVAPMCSDRSDSAACCIVINTQYAMKLAQFGIPLVPLAKIVATQFFSIDPLSKVTNYTMGDSFLNCIQNNLTKLGWSSQSDDSDLEVDQWSIHTPFEGTGKYVQVMVNIPTSKYNMYGNSSNGLGHPVSPMNLQRQDILNRQLFTESNLSNEPKKGMFVSASVAGESCAIAYMVPEKIQD